MEKESVVDFTDILNKYKGVVYGLSNKMTYFEPDLRDDLVSVGNAAVYEAWIKFDKTNGATFNTFVHHYIKNRMVDELRRNTHWFGKAAGLVPMEYIEGDSLSEDVEESLERSQKLDIVRNACTLLSFKQGEVILKVMEGYTQEEIANKLGVTGSRISQLYHEAVETIRQHINSMEVEGMRHGKEKIERLKILYKDHWKAGAIASELGIPLNTVNYHIQAIRRKEKAGKKVEQMKYTPQKIENVKEEIILESKIDPIIENLRLMVIELQENFKHHIQLEETRRIVDKVRPDVYADICLENETLRKELVLAKEETSKVKDKLLQYILNT